MAELALIWCGGALAAVAFCGAFVWFYNRWLTRLHESIVKKVVSLALLPAGALLGALWAWRMASVNIGDNEHALFLFAAAIGFVTSVRMIAANLRRAARARDIVTENAHAPFDPTAWGALKFWQRPLLRLLSPLNGVGRLKIRKVDAPLPHLPAAFDGYRIVHVTDVHLHKTLKRRWFEHVAHVAMAQKPDLILFGGDFLSKPPHVSDITWFTKLFHAPDGVWHVRGNHDFWKAPRRSVRLAEANGWRVLANRRAVIRRRGAHIALVGIESPWIAPSAAQWACLAPKPEARIGLVHTPDAYRDAARAGCGIAISGHTHGGQIRMPLLGTTISGCAAGPGFADGPGRLGRMNTWTSRGVGAFLPLRFLCPPEIHVFTLRPAPSPQG